MSPATLPPRPRAGASCWRRAAAAWRERLPEGGLPLSWTRIVATWLVVGSFSTLQHYLLWAPVGRPVSLAAFALASAPAFLLWIGLTPLIFAGRTRLPLQGPWRYRNLAAHLGISLAVMAVMHALTQAALNGAGGQEQRTTPLLLVLDFHPASLSHAALYWATLWVGLHTEEEARRRMAELCEQTARRQLAEAELRALKHQIHPHFLFNSLNSVVGLVRQKENSRAIETLIELSSLLRYLVAENRTLVLTLQQELALTQKYLFVERVRFGDRLQIAYDIDPAVLDARVPILLLQPLVENAIKHGIAHRVGPGTIRIAARRAEGRRLLLSVENDRADAPPSALDDGLVGGVGLAATQERLERLFGTDFTFSTRFTTPTALVRLCFPHLT